MERKQPGLFLQTGPPIHLLAIFKVDAENLGEMCYDLTPEQAAELGAVLLRLSGATEARAEDRAGQQQPANVRLERTGPVAALHLEVN
jgi:hypothetical protein